MNILKKVLFSTFFLLSSLLIANDLDDLYYLGYNYSLKGEHTKAFEIMLDLSKKNYAVAKHNVALSYLNGVGVKKDIKKANYWLEKAVKSGVVDAQTELAMSYYQGRDVNKDLKKAEELWLKASKKNDEYAQFNLASLYLEQQKTKKALYWLKKSLNNKHPKAKETLLELQKYHYKNN